MTVLHSTTVLPSIPPHLVPTLKALRLGGLQDTLPLRLDQAQQQHLGYTEFLELLLGDEIERRANRALASRLSKAHFEDGDKTFENFDWAFNPKLPQGQLRDLAAGGYLLRKEHILLCGPVGVGKTHLAEAFGHQAARQGHRILFTKTSRLLSDLGGGRADGDGLHRRGRDEQCSPVAAQAGTEAAPADAAGEERRDCEQRRSDRQPARSGDRKSEEHDVAGHVRDKDVAELEIAGGVHEPRHSGERKQERRERPVAGVRAQAHAGVL
jgi:hypothetical protein